MDARTRQNVAGGILILAALAVILYAVRPYFPDFLPPPELPGDKPPTTLQTTVRLKLTLPGGDPDIVSINTQKVSTLYSEKAQIMIFPWGGKLILDITAPDGSTASITKDVKIDVGETKDYYFTWKTKQTGRHILVVSLVDGEGVIVEQKQSEVWV